MPSAGSGWSALHSPGSSLLGFMSHVGTGLQAGLFRTRTLQLWSQDLWVPGLKLVVPHLIHDISLSCGDGAVPHV